MTQVGGTIFVPRNIRGKLPFLFLKIFGKKGPFLSLEKIGNKDLFCPYFQNFQTCATQGAFRTASPLPMKQIIPELQDLKLSLLRKIVFQTGDEDFFLGKYMVLTKKYKMLVL